MKLEDYKKVETTNIDFKVDLEKEKPKSWLKSVSAFANTKGGIILFGIDDKSHEAKGIKDVVKTTEKISELINARIEPLPRYELNYFEEDGKNFIELEIGDGPITPYFYVADGRKEAFIRSGNQSIPAPASPCGILSMSAARGMPSFSSPPARRQRNACAGYSGQDG